MKVLPHLQQRFGFTHNEIRVVLFLSATFLLGLGIRWFESATRNTPSIPFDYAGADSAFAARSKTLAAASPSSTLPPATAPHRKQELREQSVNLNSASAAQLIQLPGIGPSYAERIIAYRTEHGPFKSVDELEQVKGIGKKRLEKIRPFVTVGPQKPER